MMKLVGSKSAAIAIMICASSMGAQSIPGKTTASSDNQPSQGETLSFIKRSVENSGATAQLLSESFSSGHQAWVSHFMVHNSDFSSNGCNVRWKTVRKVWREELVSSTTSNDEDVEWQQEFPLNSISIKSLQAFEIDPYQGIKQGFTNARVNDPTFTWRGDDRIGLLVIHSLVGRNSITITSKDNSKGTINTTTGDVAYLYVATRDVADRLVKAFAYAAKQCGAVDDPF